MTGLTEGLTPTQFLAILNQNLIDLADMRGVSHYTTLTGASDYVTALNTYFEESVVSFGMRGSLFCSTVDAFFTNASEGLVAPTLTWIEDYLRINIVNTSGVTKQYDIYESKNGGAYSLLTELASGILTYNNHTWQNATMSYKIKEHGGSVYTLPISYETPLVFKVNQPNNTYPLIIQQFTVVDGYSVNIDFGDGTDLDVVGGVSVPGDDVVKTWTEIGDFWITITGDTDKIYTFFWVSGTVGGEFAGTYAHGDLTKWVLPSSIYVFEFFEAPLTTTDWSSWFPVPAGLNVININDCGGSGDIGSPAWPVDEQEIFLRGNNLTGTPFAYGMPNPTATNIAIRIGGNNFTQDLSTVALPTKIWFLYMENNVGLSGDLSGQSIPEGNLDQKIYINCSGCSFTKGYRGLFKHVGEYNFATNLFNAAELDNLLAYIDTYFTDGVVPLVNCTYTLNGTGMGIPSAAGLASRTSILGKYVAAGKTCTISVNS